LTVFEIAAAARDSPLTLLLDYDGTLVPIAAKPELATPDDELLQLLASLARRAQTDLHLVSGRRRRTMDRWFGDLHVSLWAEHGFWYRNGPASRWEAAAEIPATSLERINPLFEAAEASAPGSFLERKSASIAWHYRLVDPAIADAEANKLRTELAGAVENTRLSVLEGKKVIEVKLRQVNKSLVAKRLAQRLEPGRLMIAIGDDHTDEDLFCALPLSSVTISVGRSASCARYQLASHVEVRQILRSLL